MSETMDYIMDDEADGQHMQQSSSPPQCQTSPPRHPAAPSNAASGAQGHNYDPVHNTDSWHVSGNAFRTQNQYASGSPWPSDPAHAWAQAYSQAGTQTQDHRNQGFQYQGYQPQGHQNTGGSAHLPRNSRPYSTWNGGNSPGNPIGHQSTFGPGNRRSPQVDTPGPINRTQGQTQTQTQATQSPDWSSFPLGTSPSPPRVTPPPTIGNGTPASGQPSGELDRPGARLYNMMMARQHARVPPVLPASSRSEYMNSPYRVATHLPHRRSGLEEDSSDEDSPVGMIARAGQRIDSFVRSLPEGPLQEQQRARRMQAARQLAMTHRRNAAHHKPTPSQAALKSIEKLDPKDLEAEDKNCAICYQEMGVPDPDGNTEHPARLPKCKHIFGNKCLEKWFKDSNTCPYCRDKLPADTQRARHNAEEEYFLLQYLQQQHAARDQDGDDSRGSFFAERRRVTQAINQESHHTMRAAAATVDSPSASMQRYRDVADAYSSYISAPTVQSPITGAPERRRMTNRSRAATGRPTPPVGLSRVSVFPTAPSLQTSDSPLPPPVTPFAGSGIPPPELREGLSVGRYYSSFTPERSEQDSPVVAVGSGHAANLATNAREGPFDPADALTHAMYWRERGYDDYDATMESILSRYPYVMGQEAEQSSTSATAPPSASDMGHPRSN